MPTPYHEDKRTESSQILRVLIGNIKVGWSHAKIMILDTTKAPTE